MTPIRNPHSAIRNLVLIGYRGTGKTTVGQLVAQRLGWAFADADDEIERRAGKTIAAIFAEHGEARFRDLEQQVVGELLQRENCVSSLGGGAVLREASRAQIRAAGCVIWLTARPATILQRIQADAATALRRPNLTREGGLAEIEALLAVREPLYRQCATIAIDTQGQSTQAVAEHILRHVTELEHR